MHLDGCVEVEAAYYGAPPGWIGRMVQVQWDELYVRLLDPKTGQLLREHLRQKRGGIAFKTKTAPAHTAAHPSTAVACRKAGPHIGQLCHALHARQGEAGHPPHPGRSLLAKKYGVAAVEEACATALEMGVPDYRFVRRYLERGPQPPLSLRKSIP